MNTQSYENLTTIEIGTDGIQSLGFNSQDVQSIVEQEGDDVLLLLKSGEYVLVKNTDNISASAVVFQFNNGQDFTSLDLNALSQTQTTSSAQENTSRSLSSTTTSSEQESTDIAEIETVVKLDFGSEDISEYGLNANNDLVITLNDGQEVILEGVSESDTLEVSIDGQTVQASDLYAYLQTSVQTDLAEEASQIADTEPAAGEAAAAGVQNTGFSFRSAGTAALDDAPDAIGAINPTALTNTSPAATTDTDPVPDVDPGTGEFIFAQVPDLTVNTDGSDATVLEDGSVYVPVEASLNNTDAAIGGSETLSLTVNNVPTGWTLTGTDWVDQGNGTYTYTALAAGEDYDGGFTLTPPADSDVDFTNLQVIATATEASGVSANKVDTIAVIVDAVADTPDVDGQNVSGDEDTAIALDIDTEVTDTDGSESISSVVISDVPTGFSLSAGTDNGNGTWTLTPAQLSGLTISSPTDYTGTITLTVTSTATETPSDDETVTSNNTATASDTFTVTWNGNADTPDLTVNTDGSDATVLEDGSVYVPVEASLNDTSGTETLSLTVTNVPTGWTFSGTGWVDQGNGTYTYTALTPGENYDGGFTLTPPADSDVDLSDLTVTATATDTNGDTASTTDEIDVIVDAVADAPDVDADDASGAEDTALPVDIDAAVTDTDGSESISSIVISGVPTGFDLSAGTDNGNGTWTLTPAQLTGLTMTPPTDFTGSIPLTVTVTSSETPTDGETNTGNNTATASDTFTLTWTGDADTPDLTVNTDGSDATVLEDGSVYVPVEASLNDTDGSETLSLTVNNVPTGWTLTGTGWTNQGGGTYTYTALAAGENYDGGFTLTPPADSDVDFTNLTVTATATDSNGDTASSTDTIAVIVDAVADTPDVDGQNVSGDEDTAIALDIDTAVTDTDGSESISSVVISDVPTGFSLSAGTNNGDGTWTLTPAQLTGLTISSPTDYIGTITLTVTSTATETPTDDETVISNNSATASDTFTVTWSPAADEPDLTVNTNGSDATVLEDGSVYVPVEASLNDPSGTETLSLTVTNVPTGWTLTGTGWTNQGGGTYTYTALAAGENYDGGFTLTPPADSDVDLSDLTVTATATDTNGDTASTTDEIDVVVDAVADAPDVDAQNTSGNENTALDVDVDALVTDLDGSESISSVVISGVPTGFSLSAGTDNGDGTWTLSEGDLSGLTISSPTDYVGSIPLTVTVTSSETPTDGETNTGNNTATASDTFTATWVDTPELIVGEDTSETLTGGAAGDIIVGDTGGSITTQPDTNYTLNIVIDVTGSLIDEFDMIQNAVNSLLDELSTYDAGTIQVNIIPFVPVVDDGDGTYSSGSITAESGDIDSDLSLLQDYVDDLNAWGATNFESTLVEATEIIEDNSLSDGEVYTLLISDGQGNAYSDDAGNVYPTPYTVDPSASQNEVDVQDQINGNDDGSDEIAAFQATSTEVYSIIVGEYWNAQAILMADIDSTDNFDVLTDDEDLDSYASLFQEAAEVTTLDNAGSDVINGGAGDDILYGDVLFTDDLADSYGLSTVDGAGFEVFTILENNVSGWDREDTIDYIENNSVALSEESNLNGEVREGGNDTINGGSGDDIIFGQEGDDVINGGTGSDDLYGGSGADTFLFTATDGQTDTIHDFDASEGDVIDISSLLTSYNEAEDAITDFVRVTQSGGDTIIQINADGAGSDWTAIATVDDVNLGTNEANLVANGTIIV